MFESMEQTEQRSLHRMCLEVDGLLGSNVLRFERLSGKMSTCRVRQLDQVSKELSLYVVNAQHS